VTLILLVLAKFGMYVALCRFAVRMLALPVEIPRRFAVKFGLIRLAIGLLSGLVIFSAFGFLQNSGLGDVPSYLLTFGIARYVEWFLVLHLIAIEFNRSPASFGLRGQQWVALGTLANVLVDQLVLQVDPENFKFVC
jgi:hypothetical protein